MRLVVTGREGQVARALAEVCAAEGVDVIAVGRPDFDLLRPETVRPALAAAMPEVIVNAAAYTAVDKAETEPKVAMAINAAGAGAVAEAAAALGVPLVHLSTDYVFDGTGRFPYREVDPTGPLGAYGASKLQGEQAVRDALPRHAILRTAWVYSPFGHNFVRTMLRLAETREEVGVVADQHGSPTAAHDLAAAVVAVARRLARPGPGGEVAPVHGVLHVAGTGEAVWADVAEAVFARSAALGGPRARVRRIATADYPTLARRPANGRLDTERLASVFGLRLPPWRQSLDACVTRLLTGR